MTDKDNFDRNSATWARDEAHEGGMGQVCKYCGQENGSPDPDVLCPECRECFGHAFYSEL